MADNRPIRDGDNVNFTGAFDELADGSYSPKASILAGDGTTTPVSPATTGGQATSTTAVNTVATNIGAPNEGAAGTDTATSGLNGLFKRYLQRFTTFLSLIPAALTGSGNFKVAVQESVALVLAAGTALAGKFELAASTGTRVEATIAVGGTAQNLFSATPTNGFEVVNPHASEALYIRENAAATVADNSTSIPILPKSSYTSPTGYKPTGDISVIAATAGHAVIGRRW